MIDYKAYSGIVYIVGAGPGDLQLISIKGKSLIEQADVLVYDNLINDRLLDFIKEGCQLKFVGKSAGKKSIKQEEINKILVEEAKSRKIVVRLKGGDSMIFSRIHEEIDTLESEKISYEIIPGVTSASACAAYAGIPLTQRSKSSSIIF